jgi:hypothetical protein
MPASIRSVLASCPVAFAKSRTCRGLTTTTGNASAARAATQRSSYPPVASRTMSSGASTRSRSTSVRTPRSSFATVHRSPLGLTATTNSALATSMPTSICTPPKRECRPRPVLVRIRARPEIGPRNCSGSCDLLIRDAAPATERCSPPSSNRAGAPHQHDYNTNQVLDTSSTLPRPITRGRHTKRPPAEADGLSCSAS